MKRTQALIALLVGMSLAAPLFAAEALMTCPKSYQNIMEGDSEADVLSKCGEPVSKSTQMEDRFKELSLEVWTYSASSSASNTQDVSFVFSDEGLYEINVAGSNVSSMSMCNALFTVKVSTQDDIQNACGDASDTSTQTRKIPEGKQEVTSWVYQVNPYQPKQILKFVDGALVSVQ